MAAIQASGTAFPPLLIFCGESVPDDLILPPNIWITAGANGIKFSLSSMFSDPFLKVGLMEK